jgi:hypothetical protein
LLCAQELLIAADALPLSRDPQRFAVVSDCYTARSAEQPTVVPQDVLPNLALPNAFAPDRTDKVRH